MNKTVIRPLLSVAAVVLLLSFTACSKKAKNDGSAEGGGAVSDSDISSGAADSDSGKAMGLRTVHYAYDSAVLDAGAKADLDHNAGILKNNTSVKIQIEGHCDERGGIQYNIALGERRANSARSYLTHHGVKGNRITVISYGKEKPVDSGSSEESWSKNRRANFRITER